jgi:2-amino-4-hydroxy-6-hydroxymethyldihydropteridine diphosphokinase
MAQSGDRTRAWLAVGSNLGDRGAFLEAARSGISGDGVDLVGASEVEETAPLGGLDQPPYLNQMLVVETALTPAALLDRCHAIERAAGRTREVRWGSRTLDLDLVRYGDVLCDLPELTLPHPGLRDRTFWARQIAALETDG